MKLFDIAMKSWRNFVTGSRSIGKQGDSGRRRFLESSAGMIGLCCSLLPERLLHAAEVPEKADKPVAELPDRTPGWVPSDPPNSPIGDAKGIFPGRVVWVRDSSATPWKGDLNTGSHWWDDNTGINQTAVDSMVSRSLRALAGAKNDRQAWEKIFHHHNRTNKSGNVGYRKGEVVALKVNCNNCYAGYADVDDQVDAAPQSVLAILRQLVHNAGVPQDNIVVYEAVRVIPDRIYKPCHAEFPKVIWMDSKGDGVNGRQPLTWHKNAFSYSVTENNTCGTSVPEVVFQSKYIINMALLKGHPTCGFTLTAKNHYGSIDGRDHKMFINTWQHKMGIYNPFVDLIGTRQLGGKTILFMVDALFGTRDANDPVIAEFAGWARLFGGQWSSSYLMSLDPVAIDSVGLDFLHSEFGGYLASSRGRGHDLHADNYLHEAAQASKAASGTVYKPDGTALASLGVHEHWNNGKDKQYSRNLSSRGKGIELVAVHDERRQTRT
ncbi:MAG TPA: DUF362 domain-containing protein [Clostridia bacterium]|nr:DUF362 domain-containing protein [Clostridia bacterium]